MSHGHIVTGQNVTRTKCHRTKCHRIKCHRTKCHRIKLIFTFWLRSVHPCLSAPMWQSKFSPGLPRYPKVTPGCAPAGVLRQGCIGVSLLILHSTTPAQKFIIHLKTGKQMSMVRHFVCVIFCPVTFCLCDNMSVWRLVLWQYVYVTFCPVTICLCDILSCDILSIMWQYGCDNMSCDNMSCDNVSATRSCCSQYSGSFQAASLQSMAVAHRRRTWKTLWQFVCLSVCLSVSLSVWLAVCLNSERHE